MKHLQSYNESINLDTAYDYEYHSTEEGDVDGDKFTTYYYTFTGKDKEKYYVSLSYFDYNLGSFTADFQDEKTFLKDREEGKDFLTYTYINTNKFDAFKVITTVFKIIKDFYEHNIETLDGFNFNCEDDKRHNIYKHIISKLFPTWKLTKDEKDSDGTWDLTYDFGDALTESLRDKMVGKSKDELNKAYSNIFDSIQTRVDDSFISEEKENEEVAKNLNSNISDLYLLFEDDEHYYTLQDLLNKKIKDKESIDVIIDNDEYAFKCIWYCYPEEKIAMFGRDNSPREIMIMINKEYVKELFINKDLNESLRDKMTPVELTGDKKIIVDASLDCDSISLRPTEMFSHKGIYSFSITNHTHRSEDVDIDIDYYTDKWDYNLTRTLSKGSEYRWIITINGAGIKEEVKANTWGEALVGLIDILFPNIEEQIESAESTLNMYKKSDQNLADSWVQKYELKILPRLRKILELRTKYSEKTNESLRDKMTPKSEEEIDSAFKNLVKDSTPLSEYLHLETEEFKEISRLTGKPLDKLYYVDDEESAHFVMLHDHFASFLDSIPGSELGNPIEVKNNKYKNHYGKWYCYPQFDLAYWYQDDGIVGWVFSEDTFKNN